MTATTLTKNLDANASVTPLNELELRDALGTTLAIGQRVEHVRTGERAVIVRLDKRSRRAVISFELAEGEAPRNDTMRQGHLLKVRKSGGKVLMAKAAVKSGKAKA